MALLALNGPSINAATSTLLLLYSLSSKLFSIRILKIFIPSLIIFGVSLGEIPNTSWKKPETRHYIFNTSNLS